MTNRIHPLEKAFCGEEVSVGARLARDEDNAVLREPRCLHREQALLPQVNPFPAGALCSPDWSGYG
ncbi:Hypothetical protein PSEBR_cmegl96 [Pseudomonas brassicacearum subsp. brassicacearum NFM421]|uniref:Uncharacterized protein n=1 Tax=Pseudomonas brassicacearum (strain NFM421) TaxID=994484 RepID=F2K680_PSEBN|nr:Hypothetical protein PSEBR_cmegl96 [Pseudomonas brassicacearum subsp. brassicacearum NFM421]